MAVIDEKGQTEQAPPEGEGDEPAPSARDAIRNDLAGKVEDEELETPPEKADEGSDPPADATGDTPPPPADDASAEEWRKWAADPRVQQAVLESEAGAKRVDDLLQEIVAEKQQQVVQERRAAEARAPIEAAIKKAQEDGDYEELGKLYMKQIQQSQERRAVEPAIRQSVLDEYDSVVTTRYAKEIEALSEDEMNSLKRENYGSDQEWLSGVFEALDAKKEARLTAEIRAAAGLETEASRASATGGKAREDKVPVLPGGTAEEPDKTTGASVGDLIREGLREALADSE